MWFIVLMSFIFIFLILFVLFCVFLKWIKGIRYFCKFSFLWMYWLLELDCCMWLMELEKAILRFLFSFNLVVVDSVMFFFVDNFCFNIKWWFCLWIFFCIFMLEKLFFVMGVYWYRYLWLAVIRILLLLIFVILVSNLMICLNFFLVWWKIFFFFCLFVLLMVLE